jgi:hypothetical protein
MLKNKTTFEVQCGDRLYMFLCEMDAPAQDCKTVLDFMSKKVQEIIDSANLPKEINPAEPEIIEEDED